MVALPSAFNRYCTFEVAGKDIKSGPWISSNSGALIACTWPHMCPLLLPSSRYQRPPGHASSFIGIGTPSGFTLRWLICSRIVSKTISIDASIRSSRLMEKLRTASSATGCTTVRAALITSSLLVVVFLPAMEHLLLRAFLDPIQLVRPVLLEGLRPVVDRFQIASV